MKKLMVMLGVAAVAAITQAATFSWSVAQIKERGSDPAVNANGYLAVYMIGTATDLATLTSDLSKGITTGVDLTYAKEVANGAANGTKLGNLEIGDSQSAFVIIFDATSVDKAEHFLVAKDSSGNAVLEKTVPPTGANPSFAWGTQAANTSWQSIPEPTSGLLLLLGVAGLALKRRRA